MHPLSLFNIQSKVKGGKYGSMDALSADIDLVFTNAKAYNLDESIIYKDAQKLQQILKQKKSEINKMVRIISFH